MRRTLDKDFITNLFFETKPRGTIAVRKCCLPLNKVVAGGHEKIVELLLRNGADVNAQGGVYGTALQAASYGGHEKVVELLLSNGFIEFS